MTTNRRGFTLLEMLLSITIFALISIYLYKTLSTLRDSNDRHSTAIHQVSGEHTLVKVMFLDLALAVGGSVEIAEEERYMDEVWMQTDHSIHDRTLPFVGYIVRDGVLYRIESPQPPTEEVPLDIISDYLVDKLITVERFRVYSNKTHFLIDFKEVGKPPRLFKVPGLNQ